MKAKRIFAFVIWTVAGGAALLMVILGAGFLHWLAIGRVADIERRQQQILYELDHEAILAELRTIHTNRARYRQNPEWHNLPQGSTAFPDPADPSLPPVIAATSPRSIHVLPDHVELEFGGGDYHFGLRGYLADDGGEGVRQIIPGLWYYSEDGRVPRARDLPEPP